MIRAARSLRLRLFLFALAGIGLALTLTGYGLSELFARYIDRRLAQELDTHISQLAGNLRIDAAGGPLRLSSEPSDPRFADLYSGLYWQVRDETRGETLRSLSLWDAELPLPADQLAPGAVHTHAVPAPEGGDLVLRETRILISDSGARRAVRISAAVNRAESDELTEGFTRDLSPGLALLGAVLLAGAWVQTGAGLRPVARIGQGVQAVRDGRARRLPSDVPNEIGPLVEEVNSLLDRQEADMARARDRAADLAHGLKTPLTALNADIRRLRDRGEADLAADIETVAVRMQRTVERELARARIRHRPATLQPVVVASAAQAIARILARTPAAGDVDIAVGGDMLAAARIDADDLNEVLGNLMENAVRHATARVEVTIASGAPDIMVSVEDDGAGAEPGELERLAGRGRRDDEKGGAAGLGLAIASDILANYGVDPVYGASALGGLRVTLRLPASADVRSPRPS